MKNAREIAEEIFKSEKREGESEMNREAWLLKLEKLFVKIVMKIHSLRCCDKTFWYHK